MTIFKRVSGNCRVLALMLVDAIALVSIWAVIVAIYSRFFGFEGYGASDYWNLWPLLPIYLGFNVVTRTYQGNFMYPAMPLSPVEEFRRLIASAIFSHVLLMAFLGFARHNTDYSRLVIVVSGLAVGFLAQSFRNLVRQILFRFNLCQIPVALAGEGETARRVEAILGRNAYIGFDIVRKFDHAHLREVVPSSQKQGIKILLACQDERFFRAQLREFSAWFDYIEYLPRLEVFPIIGSHAISLDGIGGLEMMNQGRMRALRWEKKLLDFLFSSIALILSSPLFLILPLLIKLTSKGPVFYRADRLGKSGRPFKVLKFRTMYADAEERLKTLIEQDPKMRAQWNARFKIKNDPRVTPLGRFMRKTSLDEIPQLFNVFCGEMSLIGPRPIVEEEKKYYGEDYEVFSRVRPGITGLWQCSGRSNTSYTSRVALDVYYILNWSPWMDIWVMVRTVSSVLFMKGAY